MSKVVVSTRANRSRKTYHTRECQWLDKIERSETIELAKAEERGFTECLHCRQKVGGQSEQNWNYYKAAINAGRD